MTYKEALTVRIGDNVKFTDQAVKEFKHSNLSKGQIFIVKEIERFSKIIRIDVEIKEFPGSIHSDWFDLMPLPIAALDSSDQKEALDLLDI